MSWYHLLLIKKNFCEGFFFTLRQTKRIHSDRTLKIRFHWRELFSGVGDMIQILDAKK